VEDGDAIVIQKRGKDSAEIERVTRELGDLTGFFRYRMP